MHGHNMHDMGNIIYGKQSVSCHGTFHRTRQSCRVLCHRKFTQGDYQNMVRCSLKVSLPIKSPFPQNIPTHGHARLSHEMSSLLKYFLPAMAAAKGKEVGQALTQYCALPRT